MGMSKLVEFELNVGPPKRKVAINPDHVISVVDVHRGLTDIYCIETKHPYTIAESFSYVLRKLEGETNNGNESTD